MSFKLQIRSILLSGIMLISGYLFSQDSLSVILDNHYTGGNEAFVKYMKDNVSYPEEAKTNGLIGLSVVSFTVDCENTPGGFIFQNQLGYGIESNIQEAIEGTDGNWINCDRNDTGSQIISLNIAFDINKHYSHIKEDFKIYAEGPYEVMTDESLVKFFNNRLKKENYKQAKHYLELLLLRYPFDETYKATLYKVNSKVR